MRRKIFTLLTLLLCAVSGAWADSYVGKDASSAGTIIYYNNNTGSSNQTIAQGSEDNGISAVSGSVSLKKGPAEISIASGNIFMICVDDITVGTVTITLALDSEKKPKWSDTSGGSNDRYFQLYVDDTAKKKYLYSVYSTSATVKADDDSGLTYDSDKIKGLRSFDYTASDLTTIGTKKYLKFKAMGGEMKPTGFKLDAHYTISFGKGDGDGIAPSSITKAKGSNITLPKNYSMYKEGYTLTGWDADGDGTADYEPGDSYPVTGNKTLTAVYTANTVTFADRTAATTIKWGPFTQNLGVPVINISGATGFVVAQATIAGNTIDVKLPIDATASDAKFVNQATNSWTQVNPGIKFTIPSVDGATITYKQYDNGATTTPEVSATGNTYELTLDGTLGGLYVEYIQVVLPGPSYSVDFTGLSNVTKTSGDATVMGGTEYTATFAAADNYVLPASVGVTAGGSDITANCTWAKATGTLTIPAAYTTGNIAITIEGVALAGNSLIRVTLNGNSSTTVTGTVGGTGYANVQSNKKFGGEGHYAGMTLAGTNTFKTGDIINVNITSAAQQGTIAIYDSDRSTILYNTGEAGVVGDNKFVLPAACNGKSTLYICRTSTNTWNAFVDYIEVSRPASLTSITPANNWSTYVTTTALDFSVVEGLKAYRASAAAAGSVTLEEVGAVPANTPLMLIGTAGTEYNVPVFNSASPIGTNLLKAGDGTTTFDAESTTSYDYILYTDKKFYRIATGTAVPVGKAYLHCDSDPTGMGARGLRIVIGDNITGIGEAAATTEAKVAKEGKFVINGQLVIFKNGKKYNAAGAQVK